MALSTRSRDLDPMFDALADGDGSHVAPVAGRTVSSAQARNTDGTYAALPTVVTDGSASGVPKSSSDIALPGAEGVQTVRQAFSTMYFKFNLVLSILVNIGINLGLGYGGRDGAESIGLWAMPQDPDAHASSSKMYFDLALACFFVVFFSTLLVSPGVRAEVIKGKLAPVAAAVVYQPPFSFAPLRADSIWTRSFHMSLHMLVTWYTATLCVWSLLCQAGALRGGVYDSLASDANNSHVCNVDYVFYIWFKALWCGVTAGVLYPQIFIGALNISHYSEAVHDMYRDKQHKEMKHVITSPHARTPAHDDYQPPSPTTEERIKSPGAPFGNPMNVP